MLLIAILGSCISKMSAQDEIIEHEGNKYIINVEKLNPDSEMTLMDVLHMCPELISDDGRKLTADYVLSVDDIMLSVDFEPMLEGIKACDLHQVIVCTYGAVNNATDGTSGSIDLQFKEESKDLYGKLALNGSTYGNGKTATVRLMPISLAKAKTSPYVLLLRLTYNMGRPISQKQESPRVTV